MNSDTKLSWLTITSPKHRALPWSDNHRNTLNSKSFMLFFCANRGLKVCYDTINGLLKEYLQLNRDQITLTPLYNLYFVQTSLFILGFSYFYINNI